MSESLPLESIRTLPAYMREMAAHLLERLPALGYAIVLLLVGWAAASLLRALCSRLIPWLYRLIPSRTFRSRLADSGMEGFTSRAVAGVVYWLVLLLFLAAAAQALGLVGVSTLAEGLARYLPNVLLAMLVLIGGVALGKMARANLATAAISSDLAGADLLGRLAQITILSIAGVVALDQIGLESTLLIVSLGVVVGAALAGLALAFGIGARTTVSNMLAAHSVNQTYEVGNRVRVGTFEGRIVEITRTTVILDTPDGRAVVPAKEFAEKPSMRLQEAG